MRVRAFSIVSLFMFLFAAAILPAAAQTMLATVPVGQDAFYLAANAVTNKIYVANYCGKDPGCGSASPGTVTVIDGLTNTVTATITVGIRPPFLLINPVTNKIYVPSRHDNTVSVIDGVTNTVSKTISVGSHPTYGDINLVTNKIYVVNNGNGQGTTMSVIDGNTDTVTATVTVGNYPQGAAVNPVTNKIYVSNYCGNTFGCNATPAPGTVSVVDGATNTVVGTVTVGVAPQVIFADSATNKVWVLNLCGSTLSCDITGDNSNVIGSVTQIDGATLATATANTGQGSGALAYNPVANKAYVSNSTDNTETLIDGLTLATTTVNVGLTPYDVEVNVVTNKIYVCNNGGNSVTTIDGATLTTTTVSVGNGPVEAWVNPAVDRVYVSNVNDATVSVLGGVPPNAQQFVPVTPCRLVDTRKSGGPIPGTTYRTFDLPQLAQSGGCDSLSSASAYSLNVTLVPPAHVAVGYLTIWPTGENQPLVSTMNSLDGRIKANAAIVPAGYQGSVNVYVSNTTDVVIDIDGYFVTSGGSTLQFYPLTPCRVLDTRNANRRSGRTVPGQRSGARFPGAGKHVQHPQHCPGLLDELHGGALSGSGTWLSDGVGPGRVPAGSFDPEQPDGDHRGQCRHRARGYRRRNCHVSVGEHPSGGRHRWLLCSGGNGRAVAVSGCALPRDRHAQVATASFSGELTVDVVDSVCAPPATAQAYVFNATVVPRAGSAI